MVAYHGCDAVLRDDLVSGRIKHLEHSANRYDWLGPGAYFFEGDAARALSFAQNSHAEPQAMYTKTPIATPAVVGAVLCIRNCLDMTTQAGIQEYVNAHQGLVSAGLPLPVNSAARASDKDFILRQLDNFVFTHLHTVRDGLNDVEFPPFQTVRGAFPQGLPLTENSGFRSDSHVQLAVRDDKCIVGWFLPPGVEMMSAAGYAEAKTAWDAAKKAPRKPKKRAA